MGSQHMVVVSDPLVAARMLGRGANAVPRKSIGYQFFDLSTNHLSRSSFFTTNNEQQWAVVRKGTAQAFSHTNIRR